MGVNHRGIALLLLSCLTTIVLVSPAGAAKKGCSNPAAIEDHGNGWTTINPPQLPPRYNNPTLSGVGSTGETTVRNDLAVVAVDPMDPRVIYGRDESTQLIVKSSDGGCNWTELRKLGDPAAPPPPPGQSRATFSRVVTPGPKGWVWVGRSEGGKLYLDKSTDGGTTWTPVEVSSIPGGNWTFAPSDPNVIYRTSQSSNGMDSYQQAYDNANRVLGGVLPQEYRPQVESVEVVHASFDGGVTWTQQYGTTDDRENDPATGAGDDMVDPAIVDPLDPKSVWTVSSRRLRHSTDGGKTWNTVIPVELWQRQTTKGFTMSAELAIHHAPGKPAQLFAINNDDGKGYGEVYAFRSNDGGQTWQTEYLPGSGSLAFYSPRGTLVVGMSGQYAGLYKYDPRVGSRSGANPWILLPPPPGMENQTWLTRNPSNYYSYRFQNVTNTDLAIVMERYAARL